MCQISPRFINVLFGCHRIQLSDNFKYYPDNVLTMSTINEMWDKISKSDALKMGFNLYLRWLDEHEYENIDEYLNVMQKYVPETIKAHKRPFGFSIQCDDGVLVLKFKLKGNKATVTAVKKP